MNPLAIFVMSVALVVPDAVLAGRDKGKADAHTLATSAQRRGGPLLRQHDGHRAGEWDPYVGGRGRISKGIPGPDSERRHGRGG